jgi:HAD superfamily hydrolase (TIGR01662 family)
VIKAIIFDWDGVLVDSLSVNFQIYRIVENKIGIKVLPNDAKGDHFELDWKKLFYRIGITEDKILKKVTKIYGEELKKVEKDVKLFPGIVKILEELNKKYSLGVVSNTHTKRIEKIMDHLKIKKYFKIVIGGKLGKMKPDPGTILECIKKLGVTPKETVYVGDMDEDITTGKNAKVKLVVAVTYGFHSEKKFDNFNPDIIYSSPKELIKLLELSK